MAAHVHVLEYAELTEQPRQAPLDYASLWTRLAGFLMDTMVVSTLALAAADVSRYVILALPLKWSSATAAYVSAGVFAGASLVVGVALLPAFWVWRGQSPGQITFRLKVVRADGDVSRLTWGCALLRFLGYFASVLPLFAGFVWAFFDRRKQAFHDKIADTVVVQIALGATATRAGKRE